MRSFHHRDRGVPRPRWSALLDDARLPLLDLTGCARVVVVAAHPDDESLGAGGLLASCATAGRSVRLLVVTDGEGSHPDSPTHPPAALAARRRHELAEAAAELGLPSTSVTCLGLPDGAVADHLDAVVTALVELVGDGRDCLVVAPYRADGHPDHEAVGHCAAAAAHRTGAMLAEYPIWLWHAGEATDLPVDSMVRLPLSAQAQAAKRAAIHRHASQVRRLSDQPGDEVLLTPVVLQHFDGDEHFVLTSPDRAPDTRLDQLHAADPDPWGVESRWYEQRKRSLLLAALPSPRLGRVLEIGCSTGVLTEALLTRADRVVALDSSPTALDILRARLPGRVDLRLLGRLDVRLMDVPHDWPPGTFDLVVVSEVGYFLSPCALEDLVRRVVGCLSAQGVVVLCHWRHPVQGWLLDGAAVHRAFQDAGLPPRSASYCDRDVEIVVHAHPDQWPDPRR